MRAATLVLCLLAVAAAAGQTSRQPDHVLDVVTYTRTPDTTAPSEPRGVPAGHVSATSHPRRGANLRARLASLDLSSYETGDPVVYEIELENAGSRSVVLPWSPDSVRFASETSDGARPSEAIISLEVWDATARRRLATLEPLSLFGSPSVGGSLQSLAPGEIALIRVPGVWRAVESERRAMLREPRGAVQVKARITLVQEQVVVRTTNAKLVSVHDRLRR